MITKELLELLACPACKGPVQPSPALDSFRCPACKLVYPVRDGIPIFIESEAKKEQ